MSVLVVKSISQIRFIFHPKGPGFIFILNKCITTHAYDNQVTSESLSKIESEREKPQGLAMSLLHE